MIDECHVNHPFFPLDDQAILAIEAFLCVVFIQTNGVTVERENIIQFFLTIYFVWDHNIGVHFISIAEVMKICFYPCRIGTFGC